MAPLSFSRSHANAYKVWLRTPTGGKRAAGHVVKQDDGSWVYAHGNPDLPHTVGATRVEAVTNHRSV